MTVINFYHDGHPYDYLANTSKVPVVFWKEGKKYKVNQSECIWQASKNFASKTAEDLLTNVHQSGVQALGKTADLQNPSFKYADFKIPIMKELVEMKISQHLPYMIKALQGATEIREASPTDSFWGTAPKPGGSQGENHLGRIIWEVKEEYMAKMQRGEPVDIRCGFSQETCEKLGIPYDSSHEFCGAHRLDMSQLNALPEVTLAGQHDWNADIAGL
jgi:predicted NAD-dependent protein-ADP-ribosyltransferase YbiA (DUF1768 family)